MPCSLNDGKGERIIIFGSIYESECHSGATKALVSVLEERVDPNFLLFFLNFSSRPVHSS